MAHGARAGYIGASRSGGDPGGNEGNPTASPDSNVLPSAGPIFVRLMRYVRPYAWVVVAALVCGLTYAATRNARAYLVRPLIDEVVMPQQASGLPLDLGGLVSGSGLLGTGEADPEAPASGAASPDEAALRAKLAEQAEAGLGRVMLLAALIVLLLPLAHFGQLYLVQYFLGRALVDIQQDLCTKVLALPLGHHVRGARGELLSRTMNDATRAHTALDLVFGDVVQGALALVIGGGLLLFISWQLTLSMLIIGPLVALVIGIFGRRIRKASRRRQESLADVTRRLLEILSGIKVIKAFRAEASEGAAFERENLRYFQRNMKVVKNRALARTFVEGLNNAIGVGVLLVGIAVVANQWFGLSIGSLFAFFMVMQSTYRPVKDLTKGWTHLMDALPAAERFFELLDEPEDVADPPDARHIDGVHEGIRLRDVSFSYGREPVLEHVDLEVKAGEVIAIVGRTGAGKSTLGDLLMRFHDPISGAIEVDGVDLREIARESWLDQLAVVAQEPFLFAGNLLDNIRYGAPDATREEVEAAAAAAHVKEFVDELPQGYRTEVGESGAQLSGGQRQRVTIARALVRNPQVLIFDEATSALDARSERYVQDAVASLLRGRTVFVIAHRLSTVRQADRIVVLEGGRVAAVGPHDELIRDNALYRELVSLQVS